MQKYFLLVFCPAQPEHISFGTISIKDGLGMAFLVVSLLGITKKFSAIFW